MYVFSFLQLGLLFAVTVLLGSIIGFILATVRTKKVLRDEAVLKLEAEVASLEQSKLKVINHFQQTASLLHEMTDHYNVIYEHMTESAETSCDEQDSGAVLESLQPELLLKDNVIRIDRTALIQTNEKS